MWEINTALYRTSPQVLNNLAQNDAKPKSLSFKELRIVYVDETNATLEALAVFCW